MGIVLCLKSKRRFPQTNSLKLLRAIESVADMFVSPDNIVFEFVEEFQPANVHVLGGDTSLCDPCPPEDTRIRGMMIFYPDCIY
jgi:hypothetical protein